MSAHRVVDDLKKLIAGDSGKVFQLSAGAHLLAWGATVPANGVAGYAKHCMFFHTDGTGGDDAWYVNLGSDTSCQFSSFASISGTDFGSGGIKADVIAESTSAAGVTADGVLCKDQNVTATTVDATTITGATLAIESLNPMTIKLNDTNALQLDDIAITAFAGASATAGTSVYMETQVGGAGTGAGTAGGLMNIKTGAAGAAAAGTGNAGANGGAFNLQTGNGSAVGTQAGGTADGGSGGVFTIQTGNGAGGGAASGTDGSGGNFIVQTGVKGTGGSAAGIDGQFVLAFGGVTTTKFGNAAITDFAAASATAGASTFVESQKGGAGTGAGTAGGSMTITAGAAGAAAAGTGNAGANGGALNFVAGAASGVGTQAGGTANGGAGGNIAFTCGAGGNGGAASGTDGNGGDFVITCGAAGSGGSVAGVAGALKFGAANSFIAADTGNPAFGTGKGFTGAADIANVSKWVIIKDNTGARLGIPAWAFS